jgi:YHS domain-containing protein
MFRALSYPLVALACLILVPVAGADKPAAEAAAALHGYCPVAYAVMGKAVQGDPKIALDHNGRHYVFANEDAKNMFSADPGKYSVAYDGWCATAAVMGKKVEGAPEIFAVRDGVTYVFSSNEAKMMFEKDPGHHAYTPAYEGWCATAMAMGEKVHSAPGLFTVVDGRTFFFSSAEAQTMFEKDPKGVTTKADAAWKGLVKDAQKKTKNS